MLTVWFIIQLENTLRNSRNPCTIKWRKAVYKSLKNKDKYDNNVLQIRRTTREPVHSPSSYLLLVLKTFNSFWWRKLTWSFLTYRQTHGPSAVLEYPSQKEHASGWQVHAFNQTEYLKVNIKRERENTAALVIPVSSPPCTVRITGVDLRQDYFHCRFSTYQSLDKARTFLMHPAGCPHSSYIIHNMIKTIRKLH